MAGLYFHIPWCRRVCSYCNFHFSTNTKDLEPLTAALIQDLAINHAFIETRSLASLYFGGGTPSMIPIAGIKALINAASNYFTWSPNAEITLEANPEDITEEKLQQWKEAGINRLSIGIQSLSDEDLS
ncbi:MAG: radical SAM protein, partial [Bacteroidia bacterium]